MTLDEFWSLIETSGRGAEDCDAHADRLTTRLASLPPEEIEAFDRHFNERVDEAYRWDLWAVAYVMNGGCSDDGFHYFRGWLIAKGRAFFEAALASAVNAAEGVTADDDIECEEIHYAADRAYQSVTGRDLPASGSASPRVPVGEPWEEDDLERLYPELYERFP